MAKFDNCKIITGASLTFVKLLNGASMTIVKL